MAKKRSKSQSIGEVGEAIFKKFALDNNILPNKSEYDYGIDCICQLVQRNNLGASIVLPSYLCVNVKTSKTNRLRAKLNSDDIHTAMLSASPMLFVLIGLEKEELYYRFLDKDFIYLLNEKYKSGDGFQLTPKIMALGCRNDQNFQKELKCYLKQETQDSIRIAKVSTKLSNKIGKNRLEIVQNESGNLAIVETDAIENLYPKESLFFSEVRDTFLNYSFAKDVWLPQEGIDNEIISNIGPIASTAVLIAPSVGGFDILTIKNNKNKLLAREKFEFRRFHDETSFYHETGLSIIFSDARKNEIDGLHYHHNEIVIKDPNAAPLFEHPSFIKFLKYCAAGNYLFLSKDAKSGIDISTLKELTRLSKIANGLIIIYRELKITDPLVKLSDINLEKYQYSFIILEQVIRSKNKTNNVLPSFVLVPESVEVEWRKSMIFCDLFVSLPEGIFKIAIKSIGKVAIIANTSEEDVRNNTVGVKFKKIVSIKAHKSEEEISLNNFPILPIEGTNAIEYHDRGLRQIALASDSGLSFSILE